MDQRGEVRPELDSAVVPSVRGQPGASVSVHSGVQPWELPAPACLPKAVKHWSLRSVQVKLIKMGGRLVRHSRRLIPVVRGVASSMVVSGSAGSYQPVIAGAKLREGITTILPRGRERSRESACLQCAFTPLAGDLAMTKTDKKHGSRQESHPLSDRPEIDWPCRT